ncbi:MAG: alpha/beta hydrolase [Chloroflexota bacterium]|nr:alpha/beta hydrolase [Chloroflexota bacterium]
MPWWSCGQGGLDEADRRNDACHVGVPADAAVFYLNGVLAPGMRDGQHLAAACGLSRHQCERLDPLAVERLGEIHAPTLVIVGDGDVPDVIETADVLARGIAGAQKIVVPGVAHMVNMEVPDAFNRAVLDFLRQH